MSKPITIPIKKHTKVRRPPSIWPIDLTGTKLWDSYLYERDEKIQDISKGLENPLWCEHIFPSDWKMCYNKDNTTYYAPDPKPSLLTKLKNRFKK